MPKERSMFLDQDTFDVHVQMHGSGYEGIHVEIKNWTFPVEYKNKILISRDAITSEEFDTHIDELIDLLNALRTKGKEQLKNIERRKSSNFALNISNSST